jgi:NAD(P)-dependent dehydrogenase (short-subunit alcohol dehydrogenase family)
MAVTRRVCLLTGASGFFGTEFIRQYAERYTIAAVCNRGVIGFATQDQAFFDPLDLSRPVSSNEYAVHSIASDLSGAKGVDTVVREVLDKFGRVDLLINAAALRVCSRLMTAPGSSDAASDMFQVNVLAPLRLSLALARSFWIHDSASNARHNRNIVNISSTSGLFVYEDTGQAIYASSKAALNHLTYHLASEFWELGIRVNAIAPDTFPGRVSIEEVLEAVIRLDTSADTGQVVALYHPNKKK